MVVSSITLALSIFIPILCINLTVSVSVLKIEIIDSFETEESFRNTSNL